MESEVAFVVVQLRVEDWPRAIVDGLAVKELTVGAADCPVITRVTAMVLDGLAVRGGPVLIVEGVVSAMVIRPVYVPAPRVAVPAGRIEALKIVDSPGPNVMSGPSRSSHASVWVTE